MGLPFEIFIEQEHVQRSYQCGVCHDALEDAVSAGCPEDHSFCRSCIDSWVSHTPSRPSCPTCKSRIDRDSIRPARFVERNIRNEQTKCDNASEGCEWRGALLDRAAHVKSCGLTPMQCCGCREKMRQDQLQEHEAACDKVPRPCANADIGCPDEVTDPEREEHLQTCRKKLRGRLDAAEAEARRERERAEAERRRADGERYRAEAAERRAAFAESDAHRAREALRTEGGGPRSSSDHFVSFTVTVPNFLQLKEREAERRGEWTATPEHVSPPSTPWRISVYPAGDNRAERSMDHLGVYMHSTDSSRPTRARFGYTLINADSAKSVVVRVETAREFGSCGHGSSQFVRLETVSDPAEGFLHDGALRFFAWVWVEPADPDPDPEPRPDSPSRLRRASRLAARLLSAGALSGAALCAGLLLRDGRAGTRLAGALPRLGALVLRKPQP
eukprot:tig00021489_g21668.t1